MSRYTITSRNTDGQKLVIERTDGDALTFKIGDKSVVVATEDMAALVRAELPEDRGAELFSEVEERAVQRGKARVIVEAHKNIKQGERVVFTIDVSRYLDKYKNPTGLRMTPSGFLF